MKKILLFAIVVTCGFSIQAQVKSKSTAPATQQPVLKNQFDSLSYAIGMSVARSLKDQGVEKVNEALISKAIHDYLQNGKQQMNDQQASSVLISYMQKMKAEKSAAMHKEGDQFLAENKTRPGVVTLPSGLQYIVLQQGKGPTPAATDKVKCNYEGKLIDGTVFDGSAKQGGPVEFAVNAVIAGWTEALQLMPVGSKWRLFVPSSLAYGDQQAGPLIKPGSTLIFEVELLEIVK
jgi:FKBP-type peptidyl-prolyl cis-trans isomerase FklB